jgi:hypothetical protein
MPDMQKAVDAAIEEAGKAVTMLGKKKTTQISTTEEHAYLKAVCLTWLKTHRGEIAPCCDGAELAPIDSVYQWVLEANEGRPSRATTRDQLKSAKAQLISLRSKLLLIDPNALSQSDKLPQFAKLAPDMDMQDILVRRWNETVLCMNGGAHLAATVMMGGLLEALLLARVNLESNKAPVFTAAAAPKKAGTTLPLTEWGLKDYVDVAHELGWLTKSAKDVGEVLRDWRNYIHPHKEHRHKVVLVKSDTLVLWGVATSIATQVVASVP